MGLYRVFALFLKKRMDGFIAFAGSQKKDPNNMCYGLCARDWIRTSTPFPAPPPQGGLSTNFNTRAPTE